MFCGYSSWVAWVGLQRVIVVYPDRTGLLVVNYMIESTLIPLYLIGKLIYFCLLLGHVYERVLRIYVESTDYKRLLDSCLNIHICGTFKLWENGC